MPTLLAVIPHPDDEAYSIAGTLALLGEAGWRCVIHCASRGEAGRRHDGGPVGPGALGAAREAELATSCALLGVRDVASWRLPDGRLGDQAPPAALREALRALQPDLLLTLGADGAYGHPDHLALYRWVAEARAQWARDLPWLTASFPRGLFLPQWEKCRHMLGDPPRPAADQLGSDAHDLAIDIRRVAERKLAAIAAHRTQLPGGDPHAIFPAGIVVRLLEVERFTAADDLSRLAAKELLAGLA